MDPIAEIDVARRRLTGLGVRHFQIKGQVTVAKDEAVQWLLGQNGTTVMPQPFIFRRFEHDIFLAPVCSAVAR